MTGYVVHYSDGESNMTHRVSKSSTSANIANLTNCFEYTFIVEAMSEHLSGESGVKNISLGTESASFPFYYLYNVSHLPRVLRSCCECQR